MANWVSTIRDATHVSQWRYINTKDNPADYAFRGMKVGDLLAGGSWIEGPRFLFDPEKDWPSDITEAAIAADDVEVKRDARVSAIIFQDSPNATYQLLLYFSDWRKELHALEFNRKDADGSHVSLEMERAKKTMSKTLSAENLLNAEVSIIRYSQQKRFKEEIAALSAGKCVSRDSSIYKLEPCLEDGLVRV